MNTDRVHELALNLSDPSDDVRVSASIGLKKLGKDAAAAVPELSLALKDKELVVVRNALKTLQKIGPQAKAAIPALVNLLKDPAKVELLGFDLSRAFDKLEPDLIEPVLECLHEQYDDRTRKKAASILCGFTEYADLTVPALIKLLECDRGEFILDIGDSMSIIGEPAIPFLEYVIEQKNHPDRYKAAKIILLINPKHTGAILTIADGINDSHLTHKVKSSENLTYADHDSVEKVYSAKVLSSLLSGMINHDSDDLRLNAGMFLCNCDRSLISMVGADRLIPLLNDSIADLRIVGARCLGVLQSSRSDVISSLILTLKDEDEDVGLEAAIALGEIGPPASSAVQDMTEMLNTSRFPEHIDQIQEAIRKISTGKSL